MSIKGKTSFEKYALDRGVRVQNYHAANDVFQANKWVTVLCRTKGQGLTFAGVNARHQNGTAERCIGELQGLAQRMLKDGNKRWPKLATANLWLYAVWMADDVLNDTPSLRVASQQSPIQIFADTKVNPNANQ